MSNKFKRILSACTSIIFLTVLFLNVSFFDLKVFAAEPTITLSIKNKIDVALALGNSTVNVSTFDQDLKSALTARGVAAADVNISAVKASTVSVENNFNWWVYDHYNTNAVGSGYPSAVPSGTAYTAPLISDSTHQYAEGYLEANGNYNLKRHIVVEDNGQTMTMNGYGAPAFKDFMYMANSESTKKTFEFQIQEISAFDALDGGGFFFNTTITGQYANGTQLMSGYLLFLEYNTSGKGSAIKLYKFENINTSTFHAGTAGNIATTYPGFTLIATSNNYLSTDTWRKIKIEAYPTKLKLWYRGSTVENASDLIDSNLVTWTLNNPSGTATEVTLPSYAATKSNGFGPMISYRNHGCDRLTQFKFKNLTMAADKVKSLTEVVREPEWRTSAQKYVVNINEAVIADFEDTQMTAELISRLNSDGIRYVGWGNNLNQAQTSKFLQRNNNRGTFVNMDLSANNTYSEQINTTADYIAANYNKTVADGDAYVLTSDQVDFSVSGASLTNTSDVTWPNGRWKVVHDITGFDNANGYFAYNNQYISGLSLNFSKPGKYEIYYENMKVRTIYSHEKPSATFNAINSDGNVSYTDNSFDPDKKNQIGKGISATQWKYMNLTNGDASWTSGQLTTAITNMTYLISLRVQDSFGVWSEECTKQLYTGASTIKPFADFDFSTGQTIKLGDIATIVDKSYDAAGSPITAHNWTVKKDGNAYVKTITLPSVDFTLDGIGTYILSLSVQSANGSSAVISRTIVVASTPAVPTAVTAVAGRGKATVSFTPPSSNGGSSIIGYTVVSSPRNIKAVGSASPITITGLDAMQVYTFTVYATNSIGDGQTSVASNSVTITAPAVITVVPYNISPTNQDIIVTVTKSDGTLNTDTHTFTANGSFDFVLTDSSGNKVTKTVTITNIDKTVPNTPVLLADNTILINTDVIVTITYPTDVNIKEYKTSSGSWTNYTAPIVVSANDTISARGQDIAGNWSLVGSLAITNIDKIKPTLNITGNPTSWTSSNAILNILAEVGSSGVQSVTVQKDGGAVTNITGQSSFTASTNGSYKFIVTNGAGVTGTQTIIVDHIDKVAPVLSIVSIKTGGSNYNYSGTVPTEQDVIFTLSDTNNVISGATFYLSTDGINWNMITGNTFTVANTNDTTVNYKFKAISGSGLETAASSPNPVYIVKPSFTNSIVVDAKTSDNAAYTGSWTNKDITYTLTGGINSIAFLKYQYSINPSNSASWADMGGEGYDTLTVSSDVDTKYYFRVVAKGLSTGSQTNGASLKLDKTTPTDLTIEFKGNAFKSFLNTITFGIFSKLNVNVNITVDSNISGTNYIEYQLIDTSKNESYDASNGSWVKYSSLSVTPQFKGVVYARAMDNAGNMSAVVSSNGLVVDNVQPTSPTITATIDGSPYTGTWTNKDIVIIASGAPALSGVHHYEYKFGTSGVWNTMPQSTGAVDTTSGMQINDKLTITETVAGSYYFRSISNSGEMGTETVKVIKHDNTVPMTNVSHTGTVNSWTKNKVDFTVSNTNEAVLCPITYWKKVGTGEWTKLVPTYDSVADKMIYSYSFDVETNAAVRFKTVTEAGVEDISATTYNVMIDKTAPVISGAIPGTDYFIGRAITINDNSNALCNSVYKLNSGSNSNFSSGDLLSSVGTYDISVTDQAGNVSTLGFAVKTLPTVHEVLYTSQWDNLIKDIRSEFATHNDLPEPYKTNTDNAIKALENRYNVFNLEVTAIKQAVVAIKSNVGNLPSVNDGLIAMLSTIQNEYDKIAGVSGALTAEEKTALITEKNDLKQLIDTIVALQNKNAGITSRANAIPTEYNGLFFQKDNIQAILDEVAALTNEQKTLLKTTKDKLNALLVTISDIQANIDATIAVVPGVSSIGTGTTTNNLPTISGTGYPGSIITIYNNGTIIGKTKVNPDGTWSFIPATPLPEGTNIITTKSTHVTGFYGTPSAPITLRVDSQIFRDIEADAAKLKIVFADGDSLDNVTKALYLPKIGGSGSVITWSSSNPTTITNTGRITRPEPESQDVPVILTASVTDTETNTVVTKQFIVIVKKLSNQDAANEAAKQLTVEDALSFDSTGDKWESVTERFLLLSKGNYNTTISWTSSKTTIIDITTNSNGDIVSSVTRPEIEDENVILTATITKGSAISTKTFLITVKQKGVTKQEDTTRVNTDTNATIVSATSKNPISVNIMRTTLDDQAGIIDTLILTNDSIRELTDRINPTADGDARTVTINMPEPTDGTPAADEQAVEIPALAVQAMAERNAILEVNMGDVKIRIDSEELKAISDSGTDLYFKVIPIDDTIQQSKLGDRTKSNGAVIQIAANLGNGIVVNQGVPYTIETNYSGFNTKLVIPFNGMTVPIENLTDFLHSLRVYVEHTDGTKEVLGGTIIYVSGKPIGIEITIDRFSSFQIFSIQQAKANSDLPKTGNVLDTLTISALGVLLILTGIGILSFRRKRRNR